MNCEPWAWGFGLYFPIAFSAIIGFLRPRRQRLFVACLLGALWVAASLPVLETINAHMHWWRYELSGASLCGTPLVLYFGWIVWWGILPQIALDGLSVASSTLLLLSLDVLMIPKAPLIGLNPAWLAGEGVAVLIVLLPALCLARWTLANKHLRLRAALQVALAGLLFLYLVPQIAFALRPGRGWTPLLEMPGWQRQIVAQVMLLLALPGLSAVMEFAGRGGGTPIPCDPPTRLVASGVYRYIANPMQTSCVLAMACWALTLRNAWLLGAAAIALAYSAGIAAWDEGQDLEARFGDAWTAYRRAVKNWLPRWRPYHAGPPARLYIAAACEPCSELRMWIERRRPLGMEIVDAETLPAGSIRRMRYEPADGTGAVEGIRAMGRALEHLNLGWALAGAALRLPVLCQCVQTVMDASGFGPRTLCSTQERRA